MNRKATRMNNRQPATPRHRSHKARKQGRESTQPMPAGNADATPVLRFTPYAWAKLHYLCHRGQTEIGGFALTAEDDPLLVIDLLTLKQRVSAVTVEFDDEAVADLFDEQVDKGIQPHRFARVWCHTHPGDSAEPSGTDEATFSRVFGRCDWAVMMILAKGGQTYARLRFNVGPGGESLIPVAVDYSHPFDAADPDAWEQAYQDHIEPVAEATNLAAFDGMDELAAFEEDTWPLEDVASLSELASLEHLHELESMFEDESEV